MIRNKKGFTLTELLAVVLIIGILSAIALPQYRRSIQRAEAVEGLTHLRAILDSAIRYKAAYDAYPTKLQGLDVSFFNASTQTGSTTIIDNFTFTFQNDDHSIKACHDSACSSYYFTGYHNNATYGGKGVITCTYVSDKYSQVCEPFGKQISTYTYIVE